MSTSEVSILGAEIRGAGFRPPAKAILESLRAGAKLELVREPSNKYDIHAVQVWVKPGAVAEEDREDLEMRLAGYGKTLEDFDEPPSWFLGYVGKEWAQAVSPALQAHGGYSARLCFTGAGKPACDIEIGGGEENE